jgi:putative ABC transport system ATP-binding protein
VLHLIAGLDTADGGSINISGREIVGLKDAETAALRRDTVGVVFQQFNLIPSLTVAANIAFYARLGKRYDAAWAEELTTRLGLSDHTGKYPEALSGGQQQRVAIARTLAARPKIVLADEPTGNLDETTADTVLGLFLDCARESGVAVLMVTHSPRLAARMDRRLLLSHGSVTPIEYTHAPEQRPIK